MNLGIIIQARMESQRLPGKVLKTIGLKTILEILIGRIRDCKMPVIVAITTNTADDVLEQKLNELKVQLFRGSEQDVLSRYYECALANKFDAVVRLTADNPYVNAEFIRDITSLYIKEYKDNLYISTQRFPLGIGLEIFSFKFLSEAFLHAKTSKEREHVTPYIINHPGILKKYVDHKEDKSHYRLTIDTEEDFKLAVELFGRYNADKLSVDEIISILDAHPELARINSTVHQKKWNE